MVSLTGSDSRRAGGVSLAGKRSWVEVWTCRCLASDPPQGVIKRYSESSNKTIYSSKRHMAIDPPHNTPPHFEHTRVPSFLPRSEAVLEVSFVGVFSCADVAASMS